MVFKKMADSLLVAVSEDLSFPAIVSLPILDIGMQRIPMRDQVRRNNYQCCFYRIVLGILRSSVDDISYKKYVSECVRR